MDAKINERFLDEKLADLEKSKSWSPRVISKLEGLIRTGDDHALFRVNPIKFAADRQLAEAESIDLFLYASKTGLFQMEWHLMCPSCAGTVESFKTLRNLDSHFYCDLCSLHSEASLDDFIQITFTISPTVRPISFHYPEKLSAEDYFLRYRLSDAARIGEGGPTFREVAASLMKYLSYIEPREVKTIEFEVQPGFIKAHDVLNHVGFLVTVSPQSSVRENRLEIKLVDGKFVTDKEAIASGKVIAHIENVMDTRGIIGMVNFPPESDGASLVFDPFLSGKRLLTTQTFRDLFRTEVIQGTEGINVKDLTFLFTDLKSSTALYDRIGDLKAFALVRQHFDSLGKVVNQNSGAIVKTIGDAVMASFMNPADAVKASVDMLREIENFNQGLPNKELILKIGIHKGHSIAVTLNDRLDYFGQTINIASRVQGLADAEEIYITEDVYRSSGVREVLKGLTATPVKAKLKGIQGAMHVFKIETTKKKKRYSAEKPVKKRKSRARHGA